MSLPSQVMTHWCGANPIQILLVQLKEKMRPSQNSSPLKKCPQVEQLLLYECPKSVTGTPTTITVSSTKVFLSHVSGWKQMVQSYLFICKWCISATTHCSIIRTKDSVCPSNTK